VRDAADEALSAFDMLLTNILPAIATILISILFFECMSSGKK
jgi:hypothetical protein